MSQTANLPSLSLQHAPVKLKWTLSVYRRAREQIERMEQLSSPTRRQRSRLHEKNNKNKLKIQVSDNDERHTCTYNVKF